MPTASNLSRSDAREIQIWSGGQTGVDRAALDVAIELGVPYRGWLPKGRLAEDGPLDGRYAGLKETPSADGSQRTEWCVRDSDATLFLVPGLPQGGTLLALETADRLGRKKRVVDLKAPAASVIDDVKAWMATLPRPLKLNVAGPRESQAPGVYATARTILRAVLVPH